MRLYPDRFGFCSNTLIKVVIVCSSSQADMDLKEVTITQIQVDVVK